MSNQYPINRTDTTMFWTMRDRSTGKLASNVFTTRSDVREFRKRLHRGKERFEIISFDLPRVWDYSLMQSGDIFQKGSGDVEITWVIKAEHFKPREQNTSRRGF